MTLKSGDNTGKNGGIYQEVGPRGGKKENYATIADDRKVPPTSQSGNSWELIQKTPDSKK